jgi:SNF2 family DNA or RNA helicase
MASPNIELRERRQGPIQPRRDDFTPRPRAPKPHLTPTGWAREIPPCHLTETEEEDYHLAKTIEETVLLPYGVNKVYPIEPLEGDMFVEAIWPLVHRGLDRGSGVQTTATEDALEDAPLRMKYGERILDPYQKQDVGQLARIEREMGTAFMFHAMGLGKTLQALAVCEYNNDVFEEPRGPTLIVVPPDAILDQWLEEIAKAIPEAKVWDYRLQKENAKTVEELAAYDYVVASIYTVSREHAAARICSLDQGCRQRGETRRMLPLTPKRIRLADQGIEVKPKTVALTATIPDGYLHAVFWYRVILDEAHRLRRNGAMARAMCALATKRTLILTGTPQQNEYLDWFALFNLARLRPFRNNVVGFKRLFRNRKGNKDWQQLDEEKRLILSLIVRGLSVRRQMSTIFNGVASNEPISHTEFVENISPDDGSRYPHHLNYGLGKSELECQKDTIMNWSKFESYIDEHGLKNFRLKETFVRPAKGAFSDKHPFVQILHNRQAAVNPLILVDAPEDQARDELASDSSASDFSEEDEDEPKRKKKKLSQKEKQKRRQNWRKWMADGEKWRSSATDKVIEIVKKHLARKPNDPNKLKSWSPDSMGPGGLIIFGEYIRGLDVIEMAIKHELGRKCLRRDGTVKGKTKKKVLVDFRKQGIENHMILLTTAKSGGEGLNLPEAATVIQISPSFNPFLDKQAQCRPLRRGQTEHVEIYKVFMDDSYEQRIDFMQFRKVNNARGILDIDEDRWQIELPKAREKLRDKDSHMELVSCF